MVYGQLHPTPPQLSLEQRVAEQLKNIYEAHGQTAPTYPVGDYATQEEQPGIMDSALNVAQKYAIKKLLKGGFGGSTSAAVPLAPGSDIGAAMLSSGATPAFAAGASGIGTGAPEIGASMLGGTTPEFGIGLGTGAGDVGGLSLGANTALDSSLASTSGTTAGAATGTAGSTAGTIGAVAAPVVMAALIGKTLYDKSKKHDRQFNLGEVLAANKFGQQIDGYDKLTDPQKSAFTQALWNKQGGKGVMLQGYANGSGQTTKLGNAVLRDPYMAQSFLRDKSGSGGAMNPTSQYEQTQKLYDDLLARRQNGGRIQHMNFTETGSSRAFDVDANLEKLKQSLDTQKALMAQVTGGKYAKKK